MALQSVSRGKCLVLVGNDNRLGGSGTLEDSSALVALSDSGIAFWNVAKSDPRHKDNLPGMSGDFDRFAVNAKLFCVVFGSYAKNAPTYTTTTIEEYLQNLNGGATILWYKDGCYDGVSVTAQGEITLSVMLDGGNTTGFSGSTSSGMEPLQLSHYLSVSSSAQKAAAFPSSAPEGEEPQSLFEMLEGGQDTAPAETSLVVLDRDQTTLNDMQNLQDVLLLKSFISVNAMSLMYKRRENKAYNLDDKVEAAEYVIDMANALNEVTSKSMGGFLNPKQSTAYSYEKQIVGAEVHSEILGFLFQSFSLPEKALAQIDGLLSTANSKLSANIKNTHTTLNHMIYVFTFEPVEGLETIKLPVLRQLYLKVDQKSWEASVKVGKSSASITKFSFKMNVVDSQWEMNPGQVERQRTQIQDLLTNMTRANLDQIHELASPSVIDSGSVTSSATFQITDGALRFYQPPSANISDPAIATKLQKTDKMIILGEHHGDSDHEDLARNIGTLLGRGIFFYEQQDFSGNVKVNAATRTGAQTQDLKKKFDNYDKISGELLDKKYQVYYVGGNINVDPDKNLAMLSNVVMAGDYEAQLREFITARGIEGSKKFSGSSVDTLSKDDLMKKLSGDNNLNMADLLTIDDVVAKSNKKSDVFGVVGSQHLLDITLKNFDYTNLEDTKNQPTHFYQATASWEHEHLFHLVHRYDAMGVLPGDAYSGLLVRYAYGKMNRPNVVDKQKEEDKEKQFDAYLDANYTVTWSNDYKVLLLEKK